MPVRLLRLFRLLRLDPVLPLLLLAPLPMLLGDAASASASWRPSLEDIPQVEGTPSGAPSPVNPCKPALSRVEGSMKEASPCCELSSLEASEPAPADPWRSWLEVTRHMRGVLSPGVVVPLSMLSENTRRIPAPMAAPGRESGTEAPKKCEAGTEWRRRTGGRVQAGGMA